MCSDLGSWLYCWGLEFEIWRCGLICSRSLLKALASTSSVCNSITTTHQSFHELINSYTSCIAINHIPATISNHEERKLHPPCIRQVILRPQKCPTLLSQEEPKCEGKTSRRVLRRRESTCGRDAMLLDSRKRSMMLLSLVMLRCVA